jgi:serine/threonine protein kinase
MIQSRRGLILTAFVVPNAFGDDGAWQDRRTNHGTGNFCRALPHLREGRWFPPRELSRTGSAITYKAKDIRSGEPVALKLIPIASVDSAAREQFEEQARAAQLLDHINIAKVCAFGVEDHHFVFVSEYLEGETADSWITAHGPMALDAVLRIALQVVSALSAASFHGLTHRAIWPSNLMIVPGPTAEGGWPFVKLINFGFTGFNPDSRGGETREAQFASPEQLQHGTVDFRSEIYSLGATMCFLLTGDAPSAGPIPLQQLSLFPKRVRNLLAQMLRNNPDERPQDPVGFAGLLPQQSTAHPLYRNEGASHRSRLPSRRHSRDRCVQGQSVPRFWA